MSKNENLIKFALKIDFEILGLLSLTLVILVNKITMENYTFFICSKHVVIFLRYNLILLLSQKNLYLYVFNIFYISSDCCY